MSIQKYGSGALAALMLTAAVCNAGPSGAAEKTCTAFIKNLSVTINNGTAVPTKVQIELGHAASGKSPQLTAENTVLLPCDGDSTRGFADDIAFAVANTDRFRKGAEASGINGYVEAIGPDGRLVQHHFSIPAGYQSDISGYVFESILLKIAKGEKSGNGNYIVSVDSSGVTTLDLRQH